MLNSLALILTLPLLHTSITVVPKTEPRFITQHDEEFVGPDKRLEDEIAQRRKCHPLLLKYITALDIVTPIKVWDSKNKDVPVPQTFTTLRTPKLIGRNSPHVLFNKSRRIAEEPILKDYDGEDIKPRMLQFQQHVILLTQDRLKDVSRLISSVEHDERFRLPFIFNKLKIWLRLMHQLHQITSDSASYLQRGYTTMLSYQRMLRHNIDVTYTVAFLKHIQSRYIETVHARTGMTEEETLKLQKIQKLQNNELDDDAFQELMESVNRSDN